MKLFLFTTDVELASKAEQSGGVHSLIVDWEQLGKQQRQAGSDFSINDDSAADVARLAEQTALPVTVRVNPVNPNTEEEVEKALQAGAQVLMLPQAQSPSEVAEFIDVVGDRAQTLIQIETQRLVDRCEELRSLDWNFAHIGLNDLKISRNGDWLWEPLYDGTIEHVCRTLSGRNIGFGGATIIGGGHPIPFIHLLREMVRLDSGMCILRRTFKSDMEGRDMEAEMDVFEAKLAALEARSLSTVAADHRRLQQVLGRVRPATA